MPPDAQAFKVLKKHRHSDTKKPPEGGFFVRI